MNEASVSNPKLPPLFALLLEFRPLTPSTGIIDLRLAANEDENIIQTGSCQGATYRRYPAAPEPSAIPSRERGPAVSCHQGYESRAKVPYWVRASSRAIAQTNAQYIDYQSYHKQMHTRTRWCVAVIAHCKNHTEQDCICHKFGKECGLEADLAERLCIESKASAAG